MQPYLILSAICHFAIADPMYCYEFPHEYQQRVKETHENGGGYGSMGSVQAAMQIVTSTLATTDTLPYYIKVPVQVETGGSSEEHPANSHHCCQC